MNKYKHSEDLIDSTIASLTLDLRHEPAYVRDLLTCIPTKVLEEYIISSDKKELEEERE